MIKKIFTNISFLVLAVFICHTTKRLNLYDLILLHSVLLICYEIWDKGGTNGE